MGVSSPFIRFAAPAAAAVESLLPIGAAAGEADGMAAEGVRSMAFNSIEMQCAGHSLLVISTGALCKKMSILMPLDPGLVLMKNFY
jgi:hypothetical protein